jgi:hypothetical protein
MGNSPDGKRPEDALFRYEVEAPNAYRLDARRSPEIVESSRIAVIGPWKL